MNQPKMSGASLQAKKLADAQAIQAKEAVSKKYEDEIVCCRVLSTAKREQSRRGGGLKLEGQTK